MLVGLALQRHAWYDLNLAKRADFYVKSVGNGYGSMFKVSVHSSFVTLNHALVLTHFCDRYAVQATKILII